MESEGVEDALRNENDASEQCKIEIKAENESGKDWVEIKSDYKLINDLIVSDGIEIKSEFFEEDPMINYGESNNDVTENREKKRKITDFGLTQVKNGTLKRSGKKIYYGLSNCCFRKKRSVRLRMKRLSLLSLKKRKAELNQPSTLNGLVLEQCKVDIKTENESDKNYEGIQTPNLEATSVPSGELESVECEGPSVVKDDQCTENVLSVEQSTIAQMQKRLNLLMNARTKRKDKLCEQSDYKPINDLIVSDAIEIKDEFVEEIPIINFGEIYNDVTENKERKSEIPEFKLTKVKVKTGALKVRPKQRKIKRSVNRRMRRLRMKKKEIEINEPSTSKGIVLEQSKVDIETENESDKNYEGIETQKLEATSVLSGELESVECEDPSVVKDDQCTENDSSAEQSTIAQIQKRLNPLMNTRTEQRDKLCEQSDLKLINDLIVSDAIEIKDEFVEEIPIINFGEICTDVAENKDRKSEKAEFGLTKVKTRTLKVRPMQRKIKRSVNRRMKRLRNRKKKVTEINEPSTSTGVVLENCDNEIKNEPKSDINSDQKNQEDVAELSFEFIDCEESIELMDSPLRENDENTLSVTPYKCERCNKSYATKKSLAQHVRHHNNPQDYKCKVCSKQLSGRRNLKEHMMIHMDERPFQCDVCNKTFRRKANVKVHLRSHTEEKPYECETCNKKFSQRSHLVRHEWTHPGEKPLQCDMCDEKFTVKAGLARHMVLHSVAGAFKCDLCSKTFIQYGNYVKHSRIHTGEKPYKCDVCGKSFGLKGSLKIHVRMHTGEKPHECNFCDKKFSEKSTLTKHIRLHTGERPYKCGICDRDFAQRQGLVFHLGTQHDNKQNS